MWVCESEEAIIYQCELRNLKLKGGDVDGEIPGAMSVSHAVPFPSVPMSLSMAKSE